MTIRAMFHICMELWGIFICLICAGGIFIATPHKTRRTRIKILMQIACMLLLGTDALSWYFRVDADETAYYMVRISNFSVFCINYIFMSFFATYVWLTVSKHQHRKPAALRAVYALSVIEFSYLSSHNSLVFSTISMTTIFTIAVISIFFRRQLRSWESHYASSC